MTFSYTHRSVPCSSVSRAASSYSRWEQIQKHIDVVQRMRDLELSPLKKFLQQIPFLEDPEDARGGRKIVRAGGNEGHQKKKKKNQTSKTTWSKIIWTHRNRGNMQMTYKTLNRYTCKQVGLWSCAFSWTFFLLIVWFRSNVLVFVLSYCILYYFCTLEPCFFSNERQKKDGSRCERRWGGSGRTWGKRTRE